MGIIFPYGRRIPRDRSGAKGAMNWNICAWKMLGELCCFLVIHPRVVIGAIGCN
jgi:hypothetical protein